MITVVATLKIKEGHGGEFEETAMRLVAAVRENEPENHLYALHRTDAPLTYIFVERYTDEAAIDAHRASDHFRNIGREMGAHMDGRPDVARLLEIE